MRKRAFYGFIFIATLSALLFFKSETAHATAYGHNLAYNYPIKVGDYTYKSIHQHYSSKYKTYVYDIVRYKNGKKTTILKNVNCDFLTNNTRLIYSIPVGKTRDKWGYSIPKNRIYNLVIKSRKKTVITTGKNLSVMGTNGTYLYYGPNGDAEGVNLYAIHMKTKKKRHMIDYVGSVSVGSGKVITTTNTGSADNLPIYLFNISGTGRKLLTNGTTAKIKGKKIYYCKLSNDYKKYRVYSCSLNGTNKKAITPWSTSFPSKYFY